MKKIILMLAAVLALPSFAAPVKYKVEGNIPNVQGTVALMDGRNELGKTEAVDGKFTLEGEVSEPIVASLVNGRNILTFVVLDGPLVTVEAGESDGDPIRMSGTELNDKYYDYFKGASALAKARNEARSVDRKLAVRLEKDYSAYQMQEAEKNADNLLGVYLLAEEISYYDVDGKSRLRILEMLPEEMKESKYYKPAKTSADYHAKASIGEPFIELSFPDVNGDMRPLSGLVGPGKYVLLDFWASWCSPCMQDIPHVIKAYEKYKDQGFDVYALSIDTDRDKWIGAMAKNDTSWTNAIEIEGNRSETCQAYGIRGIPANFLIGPDGLIIGRNLRETALEVALEDIFGSEKPQPASAEPKAAEMTKAEKKAEQKRAAAERKAAKKSAAAKKG